MLRPGKCIHHWCDFAGNILQLGTCFVLFHLRTKFFFVFVLLPEFSLFFFWALCTCSKVLIWLSPPEVFVHWICINNWHCQFCFSLLHQSQLSNTPRFTFQNSDYPACWRNKSLVVWKLTCCCSLVATDVEASWLLFKIDSLTSISLNFYNEK